MNDQNFDNGYRPPEDNRPPVDIFPRAYGPDLKSAFRSGLFLAMCILMTITLVTGTVTFSILDFSEVSFSYNINVISLLITIGMWMTYSSARDNTTDQLKPGGFSIVSGCIKAIRIIMWVCIGIIIACGVICIAASFIVPAEMYESLAEQIRGAIQANLQGETVDELLRLITGEMAALVLLFLGIFKILAAVIILIFNLTFYKFAHRLAYTMAEFVKGRATDIECAKTVSTWLLVLGILSALSAFASIGAACQSAMYIVGSVFLKKSFQ